MPLSAAVLPLRLARHGLDADPRHVHGLLKPGIEHAVRVEPDHAGRSSRPQFSEDLSHGGWLPVLQVACDV
eukprot:3440702-Pyramimonas_sp.AAC.1